MPSNQDGQTIDRNLFPETAVVAEKEAEKGSEKLQVNLEEVRAEARKDTLVEVVKLDKERANHQSQAELQAAVEAKAETKLTEEEAKNAGLAIQYTFDNLGKILESGTGSATLKELEEYAKKAGNSDPGLKEKLDMARQVLSEAMKAPKPTGAPKFAPQPAADEKGGKEAATASSSSNPNPQNPNEGAWGTVGDQESGLNLGSTFGLGAASQGRPGGAVKNPTARDVSTGHSVDLSEKDTYTKLVEAAEKEQKEKGGSGSRGA